MTAVEFQAHVKNGTIEIPVEYRDRVKGTVRVIVLSSERLQQPDILERLLSEPVSVDSFSPTPSAGNLSRPILIHRMSFFSGVVRMPAEVAVEAD